MTPASYNPYQRVLQDFKNAATQITSCGHDAEEVETIEMIAESIRRFGERNIDEARIDAEARIPPDLLQKMAEMGLFGLTIEKEYGGVGLSMKGACRVCECLAQLDRSVSVTVGLHAGLGLRGLNYFGSQELKERYLPDLATGKLIAAFSITEPDAGSDIASVRTTAVEDGDELVINGSKCFVTNGSFAGITTIVARTPGLMGSRRGHSLILVPLDRPGIQRDKEEHKLGIKGSSTCSIHFEDVRVPKNHILGRPSRGLDHMNHVLSWGRTLMAGGCIGLAASAFRRSIEQVTNRRQFNRPIGEFGMVREMLARMRFLVYAMESTIRLTTHLEDEQPESIVWESSVAKVFNSESAWQVADDAVQLHGGSGFIEETGVARLLRDCRITRIFEGANELLRFHLAAAAYTWKPGPLLESPRLKPHLDASLQECGQVFDTILPKLAGILKTKKKTHGLKIFQRQMDQRKIADVAISLYVMLAVLVRAQGELEAGRLSTEMLLWTRLGVHDLAHRATSNLGTLEDNLDDVASQIAAIECDRAGCPLKETVS
jgi:alkylation response protein AidB-like acyl-CoA dehydrogenase